MPNRPNEKFTVICDTKILKGGRFTKANIVISKRNGRILRLFKSPLSNRFFVQKAEKVYDAEECWALPGVVDAHVHFREPGEEEKEDFESGSAAAAAGGVTFVADMPNNKPPINTARKFEEKVKKIENRSFVNYSLYLGAPKNPEEISKAFDTGSKPIGIKIYYYNERDKELLDAKASPKNCLYFIHPEHPNFIKEQEYENYEEFEATRPVKAETKAIDDVLIKAKEGYRIHLTHITSEKSLTLIRKGKKEGLPISSDVTPHHLLLDMDSIEDRQSAAKVHPPLRKESDRKALFEGILNGHVDAIASDHAPHQPKEKQREIDKAPAGISGIEFMLPLILTLTRTYRRENLETIMKALSKRPANLLGLTDRGWISTGNVADIVIYDPSPKWRIHGKDTFSKGKVTPYEGMRVKGKVRSTFVNGELAFHQGRLLQRGGQFISPAPPKN